MEAEEPKLPDLTGTPPYWWLDQGRKIRVEWKEKDDVNCFVLSSGETGLSILAADGRDAEFYMSWEIIHAEGSVKGDVPTLSTEDIELMFGLKDNDEWKIVPPVVPFLPRFGSASAVRKGCYYRWRGYLNVPHPGTGHEGDPNISILVTPEMREAVRKFLIQEGALEPA